jgi:hypothetical protein
VVVRQIMSSLGIPALSTGDMLRAAVKHQTPVGKKVDKIMRWHTARGAVRGRRGVHARCCCCCVRWGGVWCAVCGARCG